MSPFVKDDMGVSRLVSFCNFYSFHSPQSFPPYAMLIMNRAGKSLKKLWCCVGGEYNKIIWFYQLV